MSLAAARTSVDEQTRLDVCAREAIRTPGAVQPHGVVLAVDATTFEMLHVSDNTLAILGSAPDGLLGHGLGDLLGADALQQVADIVDPALPAANPALVTIDGRRFDAIVHPSGDMVLIDLEPVPAHLDGRTTGTLYAAIRDLSRIRTTEELWSETARAVQRITGFDHVMVYHFHEDDHGEIVGEDAAAGMQPYLGLHFPSSDIPPQARELYLAKMSRVIASTAAEQSDLLSAGTGDGAAATAAAAALVDLSASELRSVSPHHLQFMRNMGQASTMSFSLVHDGRLIGMITCAHRTPRRLPFLVRQGLEILANQVALQLSSIMSIDALSRRLEVRSVRSALIAALSDDVDITSSLLAGAVTLTDLIAADGVTVRIDGVAVSRGRTPAADELSALLDARAAAASGLALATDSLPLDYPDLAALAPTVFGMLVVPIGGDGDFVAWFRDELVHSIRWLGDQTATNRLTPLSPRNSFSSWSQAVTGTAASWRGLEGAASELGSDLESTMLRRAESRLAHVALHDPLTGLANRRLMMERLKHALTKYARGEELAVLFIDLDGLKRINDAYGHDAGDSVLVRTARILETQVRAQDTVCRIGGDEFVVICENTRIGDAEALAGRILVALRGATGSDRWSDLSATASIGITSASFSFSASDLLLRADAAMYRAKARGRDQLAR